jgi:pimeloyl-ACP methyl ester carboxylesterase
MDTVQSTDGTRIAFDRSGAGPALILVGGAFQHRAMDPRTARLADLLAERFTVFHYDRRGRGDSTDTPPYAPERELDDLDALIAAVGGSACVFGMSSGAALALDAARRGSAVTQLTLYEPPFVVDDSRPPVPEDYQVRLAALAQAGRRGDAVALFLTEGVGVPAEFVAGMRADPSWQAFEAVAHTLPYDAAFMADTMRGSPEPLKRWSSVAVPTLVMAGGASPDWMRHAAQTLASVLPHAQQRTLEGQAHDVAPDVLAPVLAEFFAG